MQKVGCLLFAANHSFRCLAAVYKESLPFSPCRCRCHLAVYTSFRKRSQTFPHRLLWLMRRIIAEHQTAWGELLLPTVLVIAVLIARPLFERQSSSISVHDLLTKYIPDDKIERIELKLFGESLAVLKSTERRELWKRVLGLREVRRLEVMNTGQLEIDVRITDAVTLQRSPEKWTPVVKAYGIKLHVIEWVLLSFISLYAAFMFRTVPAIKRKMLPLLKLDVIKPAKRWTQWTVADDSLSFRGVAGLHDAKVQIAEFVNYLKYPDRYKNLGATTLQRGALLIGPPGSGKTVLAKTTADESSVASIQVDAISLYDNREGLGAWKIKKLFGVAKKLAPCIIYIDEIDAFGQRLLKCNTNEKSFASCPELTQLIFEIDNCGPDIALIGTTNRLDVLDRALLQPGRFERHIFINLPNASERKELFDLCLGRIKLNHDPSHYMQRLVRLSSGLTAGMITDIVNDALLRATYGNRCHVTIRDLNLALQRALKANNSVSRAEYDNEFMAYHECGHALIAHLLDQSDHLGKISLLSRSDASNCMKDLPLRRKYLTEDEIMDRMCMLLGGAAAECIMMGQISKYGQTDIKKAEEMATMLLRSGMNQRAGPFCFPVPEDEEGGSMPQFCRKPFSTKLQNIIEEEITSIVRKAFMRTVHVIRRHRKQLKLTAEALLVNEILDYKDIVYLIGQPVKKTIRFQQSKNVNVIQSTT